MQGSSGIVSVSLSDTDGQDELIVLGGEEDNVIELERDDLER